METSIFKYFITHPDDTDEASTRRRAYMYWFTQNFPQTEFEGLELIYWHMCNYHFELGQPLNESTMEIFLSVKGKSLVLKDRIRVDGTHDLQLEDPTQALTLLEITRNAIFLKYNELIGQDRELDDFPSNADVFIQERLNTSLQSVLQKTYETMNMPNENGVGSPDALKYINMETIRLRTIYDREKVKKLANGKSDGNLKQRIPVVDSGLKPVDEDMRWLYTGQVLGVEAAPGIGKTRFSLGVWAYRAAVVHKKNVAYYVLEQTTEEMRAILVSRHILELFSKLVSDSSILADDYSNFENPEEVRDWVEAAYQDLFESGNYGEIKIFETSLYLETFIQTLEADDILYGSFDLVIVDYMALIEQIPADQLPKHEYKRALSEHEIVKQAYRRFKKYVRNSKRLAGIAVNQLNREGDEKGRKDIPTSTHDAQGGMEVYRSTDYNIVMTCTEEMEAQGKRRFSSPKKRGAKGLGRPIIDTHLGSSYFYVKQEATL